jgi:hypothetical protein
LNELKNSGLKYGSETFWDFMIGYVQYVEHFSLNLDRFECEDLEKCVQRIFTESDTASVASILQAQYFATRIGKIADKNLLCSLDEYVSSRYIVMQFIREEAVIYKFNTVIRRCIESGLGDKYWSDLLFNLTLQNMRNSEESDCQACSDNYFVFSLSHLRVAFIALWFGYVLSVAVFVFELICNWLSKRRTVTVKKHETPTFPFLH